MAGCDVKTMIYHFLNMVVTSKLLYIVFEHGWETVFYHMYTVKVYYKYIYYTYIYYNKNTGTHYSLKSNGTVLLKIPSYIMEK